MLKKLFIFFEGFIPYGGKNRNPRKSRDSLVNILCGFLLLLSLPKFRNGESTVGGPKWNKNGPRQAKMDHFGPSWSREC